MTQQQSSSQGGPPQQQELPLASLLPPQPQQPDGSTSWSERIYIICAIVITIPLLYFFGPIILFSQAIARWVGRAFWQDEKEARIKSVWEAAWLYLLLYLPIALLHSQLEAVWTWCFTLLSSWIHLPLLSWIAAPALYPFTPQTLLYRWLLSIPLTYLWAGIWMTTDEDTVTPTRVLLPEEAAQLQAAKQLQVAKDAEAKKAARKSRTSIQTQAQTQKTTRQAATRKPRTTRTKQPSTNEPQGTSDAEASGQQIPKPDSLWGEVNWEQVPDTNPLKQAALQAKKTSPAAPTKPSPQPPPEPPKPSPKKDDYDWDSGDGSLSL